MITPVILSGGSGSRLWPVSREGHPKPFMALADGETLLAKTYRRAQLVREIFGNENNTLGVLTVTNRDYYFMSRDEETVVGTRGSFILEPFGRNTAASVAIAAHAVRSLHGSDSVMLVLAADHLIDDQELFNSAVKRAVSLALEDYLVVFGLHPTRPETGYGYLKIGEQISTDGYRVKSFVEKPDVNTARSYLKDGGYLWNSGMFCFKADVFLSELDINSPEVSKTVMKCWSSMQNNKGTDILEIPFELFEAVPNLSIDYAVMEKSDRVAMVPGKFDWSDIGSWDAVRDLVKADLNGNRVVGDAIFFDSRDNFVHSSDRLVATIGVHDLMVVDTPDALLILNPHQAQDVKKVVSRLKSENSEIHRIHRTVVRPWGSYTVLQNTEHFKIKRIEVKPGQSLSLQMHNHRSEHWVVVSGIAKVTNGDKEILVRANESTYIPAGQMHRLENPGTSPCVLIEVQCGDYLGEDDIVRFEDSYGRM